MDEYLKNLNGNENLEQKIEEEPATGNPTSSQTVQQQVQVKKKKHSVRNALLWTGATIAATAYGAYRLIWPPRFKKYAKVALAVGIIYCGTHPVWTVNKVGDGFEWGVNRIEQIIVNEEAADKVKEEAERIKQEAERIKQGAKQEADKVKQEANNYVTQKDLELSAKQKEMENIKRTAEEAINQKLTWKERYEQAVNKSKAKDKTITDLRHEKYKLNKDLTGLEGQLKENNYESVKQTTTFTQSQQIEQSTPNTPSPLILEEGVKEEVNNREIKNYLPNSGTPQSVLRLYNTNGYKKIIHVDKHTNKLSLFEDNGNGLKWKITYNCSEGKNQAPKRIAGDRATPEDTGVLCDEVFVEDLDPLYGVGFYRIKWNSDWQGVLLCGTNLANRIEAIEKGEDCTNSGIILHNDKLLDLKRRIGSNYKKVGIVVEDSTRPLYK